MKFYDREKELQSLKASHQQNSATMTVITGRRRIGKTRLILESIKNITAVYFFVSRKSEALLCEEFLSEFQQKMQLPVYGQITRLKDLFGLIFEKAQSGPIIVIIDEFQEFFHINPAIFSEMQSLWDRNKETAKIHLIISGSVYTLMKKIFQDAKEPLFGRANKHIFLTPFTPGTLSNILSEHTNPEPEDMLAFYILTGGVPKYAELFIEAKAFTLDEMLNVILQPDSPLLNEGKTLLIEEFGKEYTTYFSILSLIACSKTGRSEIESILEKNIGGYLNRLENDYNIIQRVRPIFSKPGSKSQKYLINDNFLNFWFRFFYKYHSALEIHNFKYLKSVILRDFNTFSGPMLEKYFRECLAETNRFSQIGQYWEKANQNEIDIVAVNDLEKTMLIAEVKRQKNRINYNKLIIKSNRIRQKFPEYTYEYKKFSLEDMGKFPSNSK